MQHEMGRGSTSVARLVALSAAVEPLEVLLGDQALALGRSAACDVIVHRPTVSRSHATVEPQADRYCLSDMASANGTYVNGIRISGPTLLRDRDQIGLGDASPLLLFSVEDPTVVCAGADRDIGTALLYYCEAQYRFLLAGRPLHLPASQLRLLLHLYQHRGEVRSRASCAEAIWGRPYDPVTDDGALDKVVSKLRRRLAEADPAAAAWVRNRRGVGYSLEW